MSRKLAFFASRYGVWIYSSVVLIAALVAWQQYTALCASNAMTCFRTGVINVSMVVTCLGSLISYLWKYLSERPLPQPSKRADRWWGLRLLGLSFFCWAFGWLVGGSAASFSAMSLH